MSRYHGPQPAYARRLVRDQKRAEAEARNLRTAPERRKAYRRNRRITIAFDPVRRVSGLAVFEGAEFLGFLETP